MGLYFWFSGHYGHYVTLMFLVCASQVKIIPLRNFNFVFLSWEKNIGATSMVAIQPLLSLLNLLNGKSKMLES